MFELEIDAQAFEDKVADMGAALDQMPFALSRALNDSAFDARAKLVDETWPTHVTVRNEAFINYALRVAKSDKYNLSVSIYDVTNGSVHLKLHAQGGTKTAQGRFAIPTGAVSVGAHGVREDQKPRALANSFVRGNAIYQTQGQGKNKRVVKMYTLAKSANQPADVPFDQDFESVMRDSAMAHFPQRMKEAMQTRR